MSIEEKQSLLQRTLEGGHLDGFFGDLLFAEMARLPPATNTTSHTPLISPDNGSQDKISNLQCPSSRQECLELRRQLDEERSLRKSLQSKLDSANLRLDKAACKSDIDKDDKRLAQSTIENMAIRCSAMVQEIKELKALHESDRDAGLQLGCKIMELDEELTSCRIEKKVYDRVFVENYKLKKSAAEHNNCGGTKQSLENRLAASSAEHEHVRQKLEEKVEELGKQIEGLEEQMEDLDDQSEELAEQAEELEETAKKLAKATNSCRQTRSTLSDVQLKLDEADAVIKTYSPALADVGFYARQRVIIQMGRKLDLVDGADYASDNKAIAAGNKAVHGLDVVADSEVLSRLALAGKLSVALQKLFKKLYAGFPYDGYDWKAKPNLQRLLRRCGQVAFMAKSTLDTVPAQHSASKDYRQLHYESIQKLRSSGPLFEAGISAVLEQDLAAHEDLVGDMVALDKLSWEPSRLIIW